MKNINIKNNFPLQLLLVFILGVLCRLPYFLGEHLYFDGDEAIVGIMAQDLIQGKNFPVFFYGQRYGLAIFEVLSAAVFILTGCNSIISLKLGALLIYSLGNTFLLRGVLKVSKSTYYAFGLVFLINIFPFWLLWATKLRGGYVTAYALSCILFYLLTYSKLNVWSQWMFVGVLIGLLVHAQLIISIPLLAYFFYYVYLSLKENKFKSVTLILSSFAVYLLLKYLGSLNANGWTPSYSIQLHWEYLAKIVSELPDITLGNFLYEITFETSWKIWLGFILSMSSMGLLLVTGLTGATKRDRASVLMILGGAILTIIPILMMNHLSFRYFLGISTGIIMAVFILFTQRNSSRPLILFLCILLNLPSVFIVASIPSCWAYEQGNDKLLYTSLIEELDSRNIRHVYSTDPLIQWQLNYSGVNARYIFQSERTHSFVTRVDLCRADPNCQTAIVGYKGICLGMDAAPGWHEKVIYINERFFIFPNPTDSILISGGFE